MLRRVLSYKPKGRPCRYYLSNAFNEVMKNGPELPLQKSNQFLGRSSDISSAIVANSFIDHEGCQPNLFTEMHLRSRALTKNTFEITNYGIIKQLLNSGNTDNLLLVIKDRLSYGVFLDDFTGCYLINNFLKAKYYFEASQIAIELVKQQNYDNQLIIALSIKSLHELLKQNADIIFQNEVESDEPEKKVRVKFLTNQHANGQTCVAFTVGETLLSIAGKCSNSIKGNLNVLGLLLCNRFKELIDALKSNPSVSKDTLEICLNILKHKKNATEEISQELENKLNNNDFQLFGDIVENLLKESIMKGEKVLIEHQLDKFETWLKGDDEFYRKESKKRFIDQRKQYAENVLSEIELRKQTLWYFELEDKIEHEIFSKVKTYPRRWFGKKKRPKVVDDDYVPPEIISKNIVKH